MFRKGIRIFCGVSMVIFGCGATPNGSQSFEKSKESTCESLLYDLTQKMQEKLFEAIDSRNISSVKLLLDIKGDLLYCINNSTDDNVGGYTPLNYLLNKYFGTRADDIYKNEGIFLEVMDMMSLFLDTEKKMNKSAFKQQKMGTAIRNMFEGFYIVNNSEEIAQPAPKFTLITIYETIVQRHILREDNFSKDIRFKSKKEEYAAFKKTAQLLKKVLSHLEAEFRLYGGQFVNGQENIQDIKRILNYKSSKLKDHFGEEQVNKVITYASEKIIPIVPSRKRIPISKSE